MTEAKIFAAASEKATEEERAAYLAEACAGDELLRRRIEALLCAHIAAKWRKAWAGSKKRADLPQAYSSR